MALMMLVTFIHTKSGRILIRQLELSLVTLALAAFAGVDTGLLRTFPHVPAHMLGLATLV